MQEILSFIAIAEKLKTTLRHSWTNDSSRQESTAEHSWMICLLAMVLFEKTHHKLDQLKVLKMLLIHDLAEAITGDIPLGEQGEGFDHAKKVADERAALQEMTKDISFSTREELLSLWEEYEKRESNEARFVKEIDKVEATIQHSIADMSTWEQADYNLVAYNQDEIGDFDPILKELKVAVETVQMKKIIAAKMEGRVDPATLVRYHQEVQ